MLSKSILAACAALLLTATLSVAQDQKQCEPQKPGPEHALLKSFVGTWDAAIKGYMEPGKPPMESKGTETITSMGDFWIVIDHQSEIVGAPYRGHAMRGYDALKKKYVNTWADTMSGSLMIFEGGYDEATKTFTLYADAPGMDGKPARWKGVHVLKSADQNVFTLSVGGPDGKDFVCMEITYTKRKA